MTKRDPRRIITADAFTVAPDLLGVALARPSRRLIAIAIDGLCIAILSHVGGRMLLALAAGVMLWRASARPSAARNDDRRLVRGALRIASVIAIFLFSLTVFNWGSKRVGGGAKNKAAVESTGASSDSTSSGNADDDTGTGTQSGLTVDGPNGKVSLSNLGLGWSDRHMLPIVAKIGEADDSAEAAPAADSIAHWLRTKPDTARRKIAIAMNEMFGDEAGGAAIRASLHEWLPAMAADSGLTSQIRRLQRSNNALEKSNNDLKKKVEAEQQGFTSKLLHTLSDVLGFGFGWSALYFTTFLTIMRGYTPGKKLLGIKVIRLDGEPITGWMSFERFGGYAASAATGLLGFAQILWDRNRQALHDKATETVVVRVINGQFVRPFDTAPFMGSTLK